MTLKFLASNPDKLVFCFLISSKEVYSRKLPYAKKHKAGKDYRGRKGKRTKKKEKLLITKERAKEHRERITSGESPSPRPIKE